MVEDDKKEEIRRRDGQGGRVRRVNGEIMGNKRGGGEGAKGDNNVAVKR